LAKQPGVDDRQSGDIATGARQARHNAGAHQIDRGCDDDRNGLGRPLQYTRRRLAPKLSRVAVLLNPGNPANPAVFEHLKGAAPALGVEVLAVDAACQAEHWN
jgi:hypothetical protein